MYSKVKIDGVILFSIDSKVATVLHSKDLLKAKVH